MPSTAFRSGALSTSSRNSRGGAWSKYTVWHVTGKHCLVFHDDVPVEVRKHIKKTYRPDSVVSCTCPLCAPFRDGAYILITALCGTQAERLGARGHVYTMCLLGGAGDLAAVAVKELAAIKEK